MKKYLLFVFLSFVCASCTYSINMVHTEGQATDVVDDPDTTSVTTNATANVPINPAK